MIREIVRDEKFLSLPSVDATIDDKAVIRDLRDTFASVSQLCVGMAANMIGERKNIIIFKFASFPFVMVNPVIVEKSGEYKTREGCLSLEGVRPCVRFHNIEVEYLDRSFTKRRDSFSGLTAEIIQHEIDHLHGVVI